LLVASLAPLRSDPFSLLASLAPRSSPPHLLSSLISYWEISLGLHLPLINRTYKSLKSNRLTNLENCRTFFLRPLTSLSPSFWSLVWSTYSLYDPSYSNPQSFGFFIDVGNGWSTIPTCLLYTLAAYDLVITGGNATPTASRLLGCLGLMSYWQMLYGTLVYFLSFVYNERYKGHGRLEIAGFVGVSNALWIAGPGVGIWYAWRIIEEGNLEPLRGG